MNNYNNMPLADLELAIIGLKNSDDVKYKEVKAIYDNRLLENKRNSELEFEKTKYKTFLSRVFALIVDGALSYGVLYGIEWFLEIRMFEESTPHYVAAIFFTYFYSTICHALWGKTLGKMLAGVKVVKKSDLSKIGWGQSMLRTCWYLIFLPLHYIKVPLDAAFVLAASEFVVLFLNPIIALFNTKRRALHDFIAGTVVIND